MTWLRIENKLINLNQYQAISKSTEHGNAYPYRLIGYINNEEIVLEEFQSSEKRDEVHELAWTLIKEMQPKSIRFDKE